MSAIDKKAVDLGLLEEDDEFEEFPAEDIGKNDEEQTDVNVWEDNWDDDTVEDDFSVQLKKFSRKRVLSHTPPERSPEPAAKKACRIMASSLTTSDSPTNNGHAQNGTMRKATSREGRSTRGGESDPTSAPDSMGDSNAEEEEKSAGNSARGGRSGRSTRSSEQTRPPATRSSARLRSSKK